MKTVKVQDLPKTVRNRTIANARRAIAEFVDASTPRLTGWLEQVADGIPKRGADGRKILDGEGSVVYLVKPDPAMALKLVSDLTEYHLPKLSRAEVKTTVETNLLPADMTTAELQQRVLESLGIFDGEIIDVEPLPVSGKQPDVG